MVFRGKWRNWYLKGNDPISILLEIPPHFSLLAMFSWRKGKLQHALVQDADIKSKSKPEVVKFYRAMIRFRRNKNHEETPRLIANYRLEV